MRAVHHHDQSRRAGKALGEGRKVLGGGGPGNALVLAVILLRQDIDRLRKEVTQRPGIGGQGIGRQGRHGLHGDSGTGGVSRGRGG